MLLLHGQFVSIFKASQLIMTEEDLSRVPYVQCCVLEAIRLHPAGIITRRVVNEFTLKVLFNCLE